MLARVEPVEQRRPGPADVEVTRGRRSEADAHGRFRMLIGAHVFGILGLIIAVPVAGIVRVVLVRLFPDDEITNAEIRPGLTQKPLTEVDPEATEA